MHVGTSRVNKNGVRQVHTYRGLTTAVSLGSEMGHREKLFEKRRGKLLCQVACDHRCIHEGLVVLIGSCMHARHKAALMFAETPSLSDDCTFGRVPSVRT